MSFYSDLFAAIESIRTNMSLPDAKDANKIIFDCFKASLESYVLGLMAQRPSLSLLPRSDDADCLLFDYSPINSQAVKHATWDLGRMVEGGLTKEIHLYAHLLHSGYFSGFDFAKVNVRGIWQDFNSIPVIRSTRQYTAVSATVWMIAFITSSTERTSIDADSIKEIDHRVLWRTFRRLCVARSQDSDWRKAIEAKAGSTELFPLSLPEMFCLSMCLNFENGASSSRPKTAVSLTDKQLQKAIEEIELHCFLVMLECVDVLYTLKRFAAKFGCVPRQSQIQNEMNQFLQSLINNSLKNQFLDAGFQLQVSDLEGFIHILVQQHEKLFTGNRPFPNKAVVGGYFVRNVRNHPSSKSAFDALADVARSTTEKLKDKSFLDLLGALRIWSSATTRS